MEFIFPLLPPAPFPSPLRRFHSTLASGDSTPAPSGDPCSGFNGTLRRAQKRNQTLNNHKTHETSRAD
ncbi:hypothetical protein L6452_13194 [Arctium lappa]|uniref:Uncharacterized protein n=1 Tax=Arctium lappa TaxID=4217 RepID=A0ACB9CHH1_ARCLA|nr:hypothetical protein L6452_13194 [Arctium lappa]